MNIRNSNKAIIIKNGKILLTLNNNGDGDFYCLPGGGQEHSETVHESLMRECVEETGVQIKIGELIYVRDYIAGNHEFALSDSNAHQVELMFLCEIINEDNLGKIEVPDNWQTGVEWVEISRLNEIIIYPSALKKLIPNIGKEKQSIYLGDVN